MTKLLLLGLMALNCVAQIGLVTHTAQGSGLGDTVTTSPINSTGGNLIVLYIVYDQPTGILVPTDTFSNTWTPLTSPSGGPANPAFARLYYCLNPTVGAGHTFSTPINTGSAPSVGVLVFNAVKITSAFDTQNSASSPGSLSTTLQPGTLTPSVPNELVVSGVAFFGTSPVTVDSSFIQTDTVSFAGGLHYGISVAYKITGSAVNPTWTQSSPSGMRSSIASFLPAPVTFIPTQIWSIIP